MSESKKMLVEEIKQSLADRMGPDPFEYVEDPRLIKYFKEILPSEVIPRLCYGRLEASTGLIFPIETTRCKIGSDSKCDVIIEQLAPVHLILNYSCPNGRWEIKVQGNSGWYYMIIYIFSYINSFYAAAGEITEVKTGDKLRVNDWTGQLTLQK